MKDLSLLVAVVGVVVLIIGMAGRFIGDPSVMLFGHSFVAGSFIPLANTFLLMGILLRMLALDRNRV